MKDGLDINAVPLERCASRRRRIGRRRSGNHYRAVLLKDGGSAPPHAAAVQQDAAILLAEGSHRFGIGLRQIAAHRLFEFHRERVDLALRFVVILDPIRPSFQHLSSEKAKPKRRHKREKRERDMHPPPRFRIEIRKRDEEDGQQADEHLKDYGVFAHRAQRCRSTRHEKEAWRTNPSRKFDNK
jgi:hypothetical protein